MRTEARIQRARAGDEASLAWVVERFTPALVAQARHRLRGPLGRAVEPDDLVAEVWAVALPALPALAEAEGAPAAVLMKFLGTTLVYRLNHHARRLARDPRAPAGSPSAVGVDRLPAPTRGALTRAFQGEATEHLARALDELPERDRAVVVLRALEGRSNADVARLVGDSPNAVSLRYNRALGELARKLPGSILEDLAG